MMNLRIRKPLLPSAILFATFLCTTAAAPQGSVHTIALNKEHVPVLRKGRVVAHKTAYYGTVFVGLPDPQPFSVLFDTGSGHIVLPAEHCDSEACKKHRRYHRGLSLTAQDAKGTEHGGSNRTEPPEQVDLQYGTGQVSGELIDDVLCLGSSPLHTETTAGCARMSTVLASSLTADPFEYFSFDGIVGLGLESLALHKTFSFFGRMVEAGQLQEPCFSVYFDKSDLPGKSEITFGGHKSEHKLSEFTWAPVTVPENGYWQVDIKRVRVGEEVLGLCGSGGTTCRAVVDTGTSMLGVPQQAISQLHHLLARMAEPTADCRQLPGPPIVFEFGDFELRLNAEDYSRPAPMLVKSKSGNTSHVCRSSLLPVPADVSDEEGGETVELFVLGEPFLQKYYTKFDWQQLRIGFALARHDEPEALVQV